MKKSFTILSSILLIVFCFSATIFAQETTGEIQGTIKDPTGAVVPNVTITVSGVDVGFNRTIQTDGQGFYRLRLVPPGTYKISTTEISGFGVATNNTVQVALGNATTVDFTLTPTGGSPNVVNITTGDAGVMVDPTETKAQTNISAQEIDRLPKGTGFSSLLRTAASVRPEPLSGQFSINGSTGPENSFIIDGQETQNYKSGLLQGNNDIPYQAVQEIQVKTSGFEAEFGGATGGVINAVTKSGSNQLRGEFGVNFNTQKLNAGPRPLASNQLISGISGTGQGFEYFPQARDSGLTFIPTAVLSGPIIKNKLWFFGIHNPRIAQVTRNTNYVTTGFVNTRLINETVASSERDTFNYDQIKLDASPFNSVRISSSYTWNPIVQQGTLIGNSFSLSSVPSTILNGQTFRGTDYAAQQGGRQNSNNFRLEGVYTPSSKLVFLGRYTRGFQNEKLGSYGISSSPQILCQVVPTATVGAGCLQGGGNRAANSQTFRDVSLRTTIDANVSYLFSGLGHHELKGGYQTSRIFNDVLSGNIGPGRTYLYYGRNTFSPNNVYVQWKIYPFPGAAGGVYPAPTLPAGVSVIGTGVNYQFGRSGSATNKANTFFVQDKWQPTSRLTFNLGLRTEQEDIPAFNQNAINLKFKYADKLAPRLGVAYALTADGKTKISAFYGRFFDRLKFELPQGSFGGNFYHVSYFYITSDHPNYNYYSVGNLKGSFTFPAGGQCPISSGTAYVCDQDYRIASNIVGANVLTNGAVDPNVKPYRQSEATVEFQREVMRATVFTARGLYRKLDQAIEDAGVPTGAGEAYVIGNPGQGLAASVYKQLGYNIALTPKRNYKALQLEMDSRYVRNFSFNLNYTFSRLYGNYSGLAGPDELTATGGSRNSPNVLRDFDEPWVGFTASGQEAVGLLPLDRTHVVKASGTYSFDWMGSKANSTDVSFFSTIESGTPVTTFINIFGIPIPETKRGDLGRTPRFSQTDINLTHRYRFGRDERFTMAFDFNVLNAFNQSHVLAVNQNKSSDYFVLDQTDVVASGDTVTATNILTSSGVLSQYRAAEARFCLDPTAPTASTCGVSFARNLGFNRPIAFQGPRSVRFGFRLQF